LFAIFLAAAGALIDQFVEVGIADPADIARRLNRRGFPCYGRPHWRAGTVAMVRRRRLREHARRFGAEKETACPSPRPVLDSPPAST